MHSYRDGLARSNTPWLLSSCKSRYVLLLLHERIAAETLTAAPVPKGRTPNSVSNCSTQSPLTWSTVTTKSIEASRTSDPNAKSINPIDSPPRPPNTVGAAINPAEKRRRREGLGQGF